MRLMPSIPKGASPAGEPVLSRQELVMPYSPFFKTLHDETHPVGHFGRGTHYSVLQVPIWQDQWLNPLPLGSLLDFAVIWDEDHDERVIEVIENNYISGRLALPSVIGGP